MVEVAARPKEWAPCVADNLESQRYQVVKVLKEYGVPLCDRAIAEVSGVPVYLVAARRNELVEIGQVRFAFKARSPYSNARVKHWRLVYG